MDGIPDDRLLEIGRVAVAYSLLEWSTQLLLFRLIHEEPSRGLALVGGDGLSIQLARIERLVAQHVVTEPDVAADISDWVSRVNVIKDERDKLLHSVWLGDSGVGQSVTFAFRRGRSQFREYSMSQTHSAQFRFRRSRQSGLRPTGAIQRCIAVGGRPGGDLRGA